MGSGAAGGGGGGGDHARSKEAAGMMALHEALRNVCLNSDWTYSVFWTIRPRPYVLTHSISCLTSCLLLSPGLPPCLSSSSFRSVGRSTSTTSLTSVPSMHCALLHSLLLLIICMCDRQRV